MLGRSLFSSVLLAFLWTQKSNLRESINDINFCKYLYSVYTSAMINICFLRVLQFALEVPGYIERIQMETKDCSLSSSLCCLLLTKPLRSNCNCHPHYHYHYLKIDPYFDLEKLLKLREKKSFSFVILIVPQWPCCLHNPDIR